MTKKIKVSPFFISVISMLIGIAAYLIGVPFLDLIELKTIDLRFQTRGSISPRPEIALAVID